MEDCTFCEAISQTRSKTNPFAVAQTRKSLIVLGWHQFYPGHTLVISKTHVDSMQEFSDWHRRAFEEEVALVRAAVTEAFEPVHTDLHFPNEDKGRHLHRHLLPRRDCQPSILEMPVQYGKSMVPDKQRLQDLRAVLSAKLADCFRGRDDFHLCLIQQTIYPPQLL